MSRLNNLGREYPHVESDRLVVDLETGCITSGKIRLLRETPRISYLKGKIFDLLIELDLSDGGAVFAARLLKSMRHEGSTSK